MTRFGAVLHIKAQRLLLSSLVIFPLTSSLAKAAPVVAGPTVMPSKAIQIITLLPGAPFNPGTSSIVLDDLFGIGPLTIFRDAQVGNTITSSMLDGRSFGSRAFRCLT